MSYSQKQEDLFIKQIFDRIGTTNRVCVEFGGADGYRQSNTRLFANDGWTSHFWDVNPKHPDVKLERITAENVNDIFDKYGIPQSLDLLSIDIDGNDFWVWKALTRRPRIVIIEFNPSIQPDISVSIQYNPNISFKKTNYFGASFKALKMLGEYKGYDLINCIGCNMIFALHEIGLEPMEPATYKCGRGWPVDKDVNNIWIDIDEDLLCRSS